LQNKYWILCLSKGEEDDLVIPFVTLVLVSLILGSVFFSKKKEEEEEGGRERRRRRRKSMAPMFP
jgi:hypothetical protein